MANAQISQFSFAGGQLSKKMRARVDIQQYQSGTEILKNFIPQTQGPASYRTGTRYVGETKDNNEAVLIRFQFNDEQSYILEFTDLVLRIYTNEQILTEASQVITNITQANPAVVTSTAHGYSNGNDVFISDVEGMTEINGGPYKVANVTANTFELVGVDSTSFGAYTSGGNANRILEVVTPYTTDQLFELQVAQNKDVMYITNVNHNPKILERLGATNWTLTDHSPVGITFGAGDNPRTVTFYEQRLIYGGTTNSPLELFFSKSADPNDFTVGTNDNDGIRYVLGSQEVPVIRFLTSSSDQLVAGTFQGNFVVRGGRNNDPITPTNISVRPTDGIGVEPQIPISKDNRIIFVQAGGLILRSFEFSINSDSFLAVDRNLLADDITASGIKQIAYAEGRPEIIWCVKNNGDLIGLTFKPDQQVTGWHIHDSRESDNFTSVATISRIGNFDQTWFVIKRNINGVDKYYVEYFEDFIEYPNPEEFFTSIENKVSDLETYTLRLLEIQKQYIHLDSCISYDGSTLTSETMTPGATTGANITFTTSGAFFTPDMVGRQIWKKSLTGLEKGRAEVTSFTSSTEVVCKILVDFDSTDTIGANNWYLTSDTFSGANHLENENVQIVTDGAIHPDRTVTNGSFTLQAQASVVHVGFKYVGLMKTMNLEIGATAVGSSQSKFKNIYRVGIKFADSLGARYGTNLYNTEQILFRSTNSFLNNPPALFTGEKLLSFSDSWKPAKHVIVVQNFSLPCTIQRLTPYSNSSV